MFVEVVEGLGAAADLYNNRKSLALMLRRFRRQIFGGKARIAVFGAGGTGKTTLGSFLAGELDTDNPQPYEETISKEDFSLGGSIPGIVLVPPGQTRRRAGTWNELYRLLAAGKTVGVVNVVCWGYHSTQLEQPRLRIYRSGMPIEEFRDAYLAAMRAEELEALDSIIPHLSVAPGKLWMITLVTKQDLWWPQRNEVQDHYLRGEYAKRLEPVIRGKGETNFSHHLFSAALLKQNLVTGDGVCIAETAAGYDDPLRAANLNSFARGLNGLIG
jgi:hypothetical protein